MDEAQIRRVPTHVYTKSFYSNGLFSLKSRRPTHLLADREPRLLQKTEI